MLDRHNGLSLADISAIGGVHATFARNEENDYTDTTTAMKKDAFRHMTWNFRAAKALGDHKTRIGTINHEWSYLILPEVLKFERETFNSLFKKYQGLLTNTEITNMAKTEADAYAIKD